MPVNESFQSLLDQASGVPSVPLAVSKTNVLDRTGQIKKNQIAEASSRKKEAMGVGVDSAYNVGLAKMTGYGTQGRSELENDIRDLKPGEMYAKYGDAAEQLLAQRVQGLNAVQATMQTPERDVGDTIYDTATDVASGLGNALGGVAALGLGVVSPHAGASASALLEEATRFNAQNQSDQLRVRKNLAEEQNALASRDNALQREADLGNGDTDLQAGLKSIGREALNAVTIAGSDSVVLGSGTATALGSLLAMGPLTKGITAAAKLSTSAKLAEIGAKVATPLAIGAMESGGTYTQTVNDVMRRSPEQLMAESSDYRDLLAAGKTAEAAQLELANSTALKAAAITAPAAIAAGTLVSKFEGAPLSSMIRKAPGYILREPVEEGIQGASGQLAQNLAIQGSVDENQDLAKGVGRQAGEGALYGLGMTATLSAAKTPSLAVNGAAKSVGKVIDARAAAVKAKNDLASPVADHKVAAQAEAMEVNRPVAEATVAESIDKMEAAPEVKAKATEYTQGVLVASTFDPTTYTEDPRAAPELHAALEGVTSRVKAIQIMANIVNNAEAGSDLQMGTASLMFDSFKPIEEAIDSDASALAALPEGDATRGIVEEYEATMQGVQQSPGVMNAIGKVVQFRAALKAEELTAETLATGKGQLQAMATVDEAIAAHDKGDLDTNEAILYQAAQGNLKLTAKQKESLSSSVALLRAVRDANEQAKLNGEVNEVSLNITTESSAGKVSILEHTNNVRDAMRGGDKVKAAEDLTTLGNFATSMSNKMQALADSMTSKLPTNYQTVRNGKWFESAAPVIVHQQSLGSVRFAQRVYREARLAVDVFNGLADAYPALGMVKLPMPVLPVAMNMAAQAVVNNFAGVKASATPVIKASAPATIPTPVDTTEEDAAAALKVAGMTDEQLGSHLGRIQDLIAKGDKTEATAARFALLDAELNKREDAAYQAQLDQDRADQAAYAATLSTPKPSKSEPVNVWAGKGENTVLSNLSPRAFTFQGKAYKSVEHAYQSLKTGTFDQATYDQYKTGKEKIVGKGRALTTNNWNVSLMEQLMLASFTANPTATKALQATGSAPITHTQDTGVWKTEFPRILMAIRAGNLQEQAIDIQAPVVTGTLAERVAAFFTKVAVGQKLLDDEFRALDAIEGGLTDSQAQRHELLDNALAETDNLDERILDTTPISRREVSLIKKVLSPEEFAEFQSLRAERVAEINVTKVTPVPVVAKPAPVVKAAPIVTSKAPTPAIVPVAQENTTGIEDELLAELEAKAEDRGREVEEEFVEPTDGKGLAALFDRLLNGAKNLFLTSFKLPKEATTNIIGSETPLADVTKALSSESAKTAFTGKNGSRKLTDEAAAEYSKMLSLLPGVIDTLNGNLAAFVDESGDAIKAGKAFNWVSSKLMNIVELVDGKYQYNQALLESAVLGGLHWALNIHGQDDIEMKDLAQITGQDIASLDPTLLYDYGKGVGMAEAIRSMGMTISKFWGVRAESDAYRGRTKGIPQSMASEILGALEEAGFLHIVKLTSGVGKTTRDHFRVIPVKLPDDSALAENSTAIEEVVMVTPEVVFHIGTPPTESSTHQLRRDNVKLSKQQVQAQTEAQNTEHLLDLPMVSLYKALGMKRFKTLFGSGVEDTSRMNVNDAKSLEGRDRAAISAYRTMMNLVEQVGAAAREAGVALNKMPVFFNYDFTSVNRLQMRGANTPTANKAVREGLLPTNSVLDLSQDNSTDMNNFKLAIGQALGVKVHRFSLADTVNKVDALLTGSLKPTIDALSQWAATSYDEADPLGTEEMSDSLFEMIQRDFKAAGVPLSAVALHSVLDYARLQGAADKSAFKTNLYVEADGVSNGPINAMMLFFSGQFNATWIRNISRGGISIGNRKTLAQIYDQKGFKDLYEVTADDSKAELNKLSRKLFATNPAVAQQMTNLLILTDMLLGKDMSFDEQGNITINRGLTKNPLTITIYGSGALGIAGNLVGTMVEALYEKMSAASSGTGDINADFFGDQSATPEHAAQKMKDFLVAWEALTDNSVSFSFEDFTYSLNHNPANPKYGTNDPRTFTVNAIQLQNLTSAMHQLFVKPMRKAVVANVGKGVFDTTTVIQKATQVQSIVLAHFFKVGVQKKIAEKKARAAEQVARGEEPDWKPTDFLKPSEEAEIHESLRHMAPLIKTDTQSWYVAGAERNDVANVKFGSSLNGKRTVDASVYAPADASVSGTALMTIGAGDAQGIQNVLTEPDVSSKILTIYDGIHLALDEIQPMGRLVNKAIFDTWKNNPMQAVSDTFAAFVEDTDLEDMDPELLSDVLAVFLAENEVPKDPQATALLAIKSLAEQAGDHANMIQARINTLARVNMSADQMAATGEAHNTEGLIDLSHLEPEQQANELNVLLQEELQKLNSAKATPDLTVDLLTSGVEHASGARVLGTSDLKQLHATVNLPKDQQDVFRRIMARMAVDGFKVVYGTALQLAQYQLATQGKSLTHSTGEIAGYTDVANKTVFLISPSSETLIHELIHAGTFAKVLQHYITKGKGNAEVAGAVARIEALMTQFLGLQEEALTLSEDARIAYLSARDAIQGHLADGTAGGKAAGLNEFMAWAGSNASLIRLGKRTKATKLGRIAEAALQAIKSMFGIGVEGKDLFSNLVFNTEIIMAAAAPLSTRVGEVTLYQSSTYGNNQRLVGVAKTFNHYVAQYLASPMTLGKLEPASSRDNAIVLAKDVMDVFEAARFFDTEQERTTFKAISIALSTEAQFDGNVMAVAQKMYAHVVKNLTVEHFMPEVTNNPDRDYYYALQKFNAIVGKHSIGNDTLNRSTLMPSFLALATVNDEFRAILAGMELPKVAVKGWNTLDGILENTANMGMEALASRLSGAGKNSTNVQLVIDSLNQQLTDLATEQESRFDQMQQQAGGYLDRANQFLVSRTGSLAKSLLAKSTAVNKKTNSKLVKQVTNFGMGIAGVLSDETGQQVSEAVLLAVNTTEVPAGLRDLIGDLIGRTLTNKNVYDMIKRVRSGIQNLRQQYREHLPFLLAKKFSRELTKEEWEAAYNGVAKSDIATLVGNGFSMADLTEMLIDNKKMAKAISKLETALQNADPANFSELQQKMDQLAHYMSTGDVGNGLLRNATAIARFSGNTQSAGYKGRTPAFTRQIDLLVSMYAYENQSKEDKAVMAELAKSEQEGLAFVVNYMVGQRKAELSKQASDVGLLNHYKGFIGSASEAGSLIVADDSDFSMLSAKSYIRVADYKGSALEGKRNRGYYHSPAAARAGFEQGIFQNARHTMSGVDSLTGFSVSGTAGVITDPVQVARITKNLALDTRGEQLMPLFDANGAVYAYERSLNPTEMARIAAPNHLAKAIGQWRGRQVEEASSQAVNEELVRHLKDMHNTDVAKGKVHADQYVDLNKPELLDPVVRDAVSLLNTQTRDVIKEVFGEEFMVRRELLNDVFGYRAASISDAWTGITRWSPTTQKNVYNMALSIFGNDAYRYLTNAESVIQAAVGDAKVLIVVKSVVVPMTNLIANIYQLIARGVPIRNILKGYKAKVLEIDSYAKSRLREIEVEAELRAATGDVIKTNKLNAELKSIVDGHRRLSIWPLIEAGEFSSVSDVGLTRDEIMLTQGRLAQYIEAQVDKLPPGLATVGKNLLVTKDTALFQGLQRSVEYGDMIAKAILYDDLTIRGKKTQAEALGRITEEFVNYDRLPGRFRGALENMGLLWFYNFKIRIVKQAVSMIRNNPLHTLLAMALPTPDMFGSIGLPTTDNLVTKLLEDSLGGSIGPTQGLTAMNLNPWLNLVN